MTSYHVYFTAKDGVTDQELLTQVHQFMEGQICDNHAVSYRVLRMTNKASFVDLPDYQLIVDYRSEEDLQLGMRNMKENYRKEPHASLMKMVSTFRVAFSTDETGPEAHQ
ncbi:MAG: hypothetical protein O3C43_14490 [Verrucomicrobia bacterium]|nr:hypothetical protein [Verrucomicrobiota bacterium]MDA1067697.1 hypothetical protein [Verrucomicrobiota bacterium]